MLKKKKIKIVMAFMILGIIIISALGFTFIQKLEYLNESINTLSITDVQNLILEQENQTKTIIYEYLIAFSVLIIILGIIVFKLIISPISNLIKSTEMATKGEHFETKYLTSGKAKNDIDDLITAFKVMNNELNENLNEATRQKKQMETILLHMTDGIIAFDIKGKVIHVNPAAQTFLNIKDEKTFEEIFYKFNVDMNIEKIIYLENWTSSEKKINIEDRSINLFLKLSLLLKTLSYSKSSPTI